MAFDLVKGGLMLRTTDDPVALKAAHAVLSWRGGQEQIGLSFEELHWLVVIAGPAALAQMHRSARREIERDD